MADQSFCLRWEGFQSNVTSLFEDLRQGDELVDITLCCEGQKIGAHRMMLSACSPYFRDVLKNNPCQHMVFYMKDTSASDLRALVEFMYRGSVNVSQSQLASFIKTAESLQIRGLSGDEEKWSDESGPDRHYRATAEVPVCHQPVSASSHTTSREDARLHRHRSGIGRSLRSQLPYHVSSESPAKRLRHQQQQHHHHQQQQQHRLRRHCYSQPTPSPPPLTPATDAVMEPPLASGGDGQTEKGESDAAAAAGGGGGRGGRDEADGPRVIWSSLPPTAAAGLDTHGCSQHSSLSASASSVRCSSSACVSPETVSGSGGGGVPEFGGVNSSSNNNNMSVAPESELLTVNSAAAAGYGAGGGYGAAAAAAGYGAAAAGGGYGAAGGGYGGADDTEDDASLPAVASVAAEEDTVKVEQPDMDRALARAAAAAHSDSFSDSLSADTAMFAIMTGGGAAAASSSQPVATEDPSAQNYQCNICGVGFRNSMSLSHHRKMHDGSTTCWCCGRVFSRVGVLRRHLVHQHNMAEEDVRRLTNQNEWRSLPLSSTATCAVSPTVPSP